MKTNQKQNQDQRFFANPRAYLSKDSEYLTLVLPGNLLIRKHINFYKRILGIPFTPKARVNDPQANQ